MDTNSLVDSSGKKNLLISYMGQSPHFRSGVLTENEIDLLNTF